MRCGVEGNAFDWVASNRKEIFPHTFVDNILFCVALCCHMGAACTVHGPCYWAGAQRDGLK